VRSVLGRRAASRPDPTATPAQSLVFMVAKVRTPHHRGLLNAGPHQWRDLPSNQRDCRPHFGQATLRGINRSIGSARFRTQISRLQWVYARRSVFILARQIPEPLSAAPMTAELARVFSQSACQQIGTRARNFDMRHHADVRSPLPPTPLPHSAQ
jgi:hypothetical protein